MNSTKRSCLASLGLAMVATAIALGACAAEPSFSADVGGNSNEMDSASSRGVGVGGAGGIGEPGNAGGGPPLGSGGAAGSGQPENGGAGGSGGGYGDAGSEPPLAPPFEIPKSCEKISYTPRIVYMSADDSNSMGSPAHARELINTGFEPNPADIRTYEFFNYYRIQYPAPANGRLSIFGELEVKEAAPAVGEFQIGVRSFDAVMPRRPMSLTFVIDTSGSMKGIGIERAKEAVRSMAKLFVVGDKISIVTTGKDGDQKRLESHTALGPNDPELLSFIDGLVTGGTTDLSSALTKAYALAKTNFNPSLMNRVVLISDGGANAGLTDTSLIAGGALDIDREGIYLIGVGTGPALSYNDKLMNDFTEAGRGAYVYLDSVEEASRIFTERFDETMDIAARSVSVQLTLPWYFHVKGLSTEQVSSKPVPRQHIAPNDAMVFNLETTACDPSLYERTDPVIVRVEWKTRVGYIDQISEWSVPLNTLVGTNLPRLAKGRAIVAYAEALKTQCEISDAFCTEGDRKKMKKEKLLLAKDLVLKANPEKNDPEMNEIGALIDKHLLLFQD